MHPVEVQDALDGMVLLLDTREQDTPRLRARICSIGLPFERVALPFGDYSAKVTIPDGIYDLSDKVSIERKMDIDELCQCFTHDRKRFEREFERAKAAQARIYLLIENASMEAMFGGRYRSKMVPQALVGSLFAFLARYDCRLIMCRQQTGGLIIREILHREMKERLTAL